MTTKVGNKMATTQQRSLAQTQPRFSVFMNSDDVKQLVQQAIGDNAQRFTAAIISAVSTNPALQECKQSTILSAALLGESLKLSPSPQLGQYYMVPFNDKNQGLVAQFILGYKGYIQLAIRSGQYKKLNVLELKKGEIISYNPLTEEMFVQLIQDEEEREKAETVGYYAMFEYINGFRKTMYWSKSKMEAHALKYSKGYKAKTGYTFWEKDFDAMAKKTMLRQLISKWGVMSVDMERAFLSDNSFIDDEGEAHSVGVSIDEDGVVLPDESPELITTKENNNVVESASQKEFDFFALQGKQQ